MSKLSPVAVACVAVPVTAKPSNIALPVTPPAAAHPKAPHSSLSNSSSSSSSSSSAVDSPNRHVASFAQVLPADVKQDLDAHLVMEFLRTRIYKLKNNTKALVKEGSLQVLRATMDQQDIYVLQMADIILALKREVPCLGMGERSYVFPTDDITYGIQLSETIHADLLEVFAIIIHDHTAFGAGGGGGDADADGGSNEGVPTTLENMEERHSDLVVSASHHVAKGLDRGSSALASGLVQGSTQVSRYIARGAAFLKTKIKRSQTPGTVSMETKSKLEKAKIVSGAVVKLSKAMVVGAIAATHVLSRELGEALSHTELGKKIQEPSGPRATAAKEVGKNAIIAAGRLYVALEESGLLLLASVADASVEVVEHKYGLETGEAMRQGVGVVKDVAEAKVNMNKAGIKGIVKSTAKKTAEEILTDPSERPPQSPNGSANIANNALNSVAALDAVSAISQAKAALDKK